MASPTASRAPPPLLRIAGELRNQIYDYVFDEIESISMTEAVPGLVQACRLLREETLLIWHSKHHHVKATIKHDGTKGAHADTEPLIDYLTTTPVTLTASIQILEITWIMSREDEHKSLGRGEMWRPLRAALKNAGISSKQIVWRFRGGCYLAMGKGLKWVQSEQVVRDPLVEKRMREFLESDGEDDCPLWTVHIAPRRWDDDADIRKIAYH